MVDYQDTSHGFIWGSLRVERIAALPDGSFVVKVFSRGRYDEGVEVRVSAKGRSVRVFRNGEEMET
jgi:hypothetical protein